MMMLHQKLLITLDNYVQEKKDLDIKIHHSIESLPNLWPKVETLPTEMELEENLSMEINSKMKISK